MDITFITEQSINSIWQDKMKVVSNKVVVFGYNGLGLVSYKKELSGETEYFQDLAKFSKQISSVVICGCDTDNYGTFRHSAVIAEKGKILGVSDMVYSIGSSEYAPGCDFRVYETGYGRIGIVIAEDLYFFESVKSLSSCDADIVICLFKKVENTIPQIMIRANSFVNGIPIALCAKNYATVSDGKGNIIMSGQSGILNAKVKTDKEYCLISYKKRGLTGNNISGV